jgi:NhaA family Na+:H+ antiporter
MKTPLRRVVAPIQEFISTEVFSGSILLVAALIALAWANSPWDDEYFELLNEHIVVDAGIFRIDESVQHWVNDCLMTLFFFVVGLEIKRELFRGELQGVQKAALPVLAAVGGMVAPAAIYTLVNFGGEGGSGWGIPMATDIAFALGVLALVGSRLPTSLRVFLLALAIADDIGAILVIAIFYSGDIQVDSLAVAAGLLAVIFGIRHLGVRALFPYFVLGAAVWVAVFESGIHATIAGVVLGLMTPIALARPSRVVQLYRRFTRGDATDDLEGEDEDGPLHRLERMFHPITSFIVVPLFALANAGVAVSGGTIEDSTSGSVAVGIFLGLVVGKPLGVLLFSWFAVRTGIARLPEGATWPQVAAVGVLAGIGFTVALFINELAFDSPDLVEQGKIGILAASAVSAAAGLVALLLVSRGGEAAPVSELTEESG